MKKLLVTLLAAIGVATTMAQDIRFDNPPAVIAVKTTALYTISHSDNDWRAGLAFPVLNFRNGKRAGYPTFATADALILTDARDFKRLYIGAGLNIPLINGKNVTAGVSLGWTADFSNFEKIRDGRWGVGASLAFRF